MNENVEKWLEALRSGKFRQGTRMLRSREADEYCCLGVACEISGLGKWENYHNLADTYVVSANDSATGVLPDAVRRWLGLKAEDGRFTDSETGYPRWLVSLNDSGVPFSDIADLIESEPEGLFSE